MILELELLNDVAITAQGASVGVHETLSYVPGQCLLGATVARIGYGDHGHRDGAWRLFHSGEVRFGCALPRVDGEPIWPMPLSLHHPKGTTAVGEGGVLDQRVVKNRVWPTAGDATRYESLRDGYIDRFGRVSSPAATRSMRTAIGGEGRARDGFLFTMSALARGTRLRAEVSADDGALLDTVRRALAGAEIRVGRSRHAEFGGVRVAEVTNASDAPDALAPHALAPHAEDTITFWCLSDLCLRDPETGQPTFEPVAATFGLPAAWCYAPEASFVRTRRYSPFNVHRRRPDVERQVLVAGSVLRFSTRATSAVGLSASQWKNVEAVVAHGVGEHRAEGLGRVVFEPKLLAGERPTFDVAPDRLTSAIEKIPDDPLARWIEEQAAARAARDDFWHRVNSLLATIAGRSPWWLPSSQWGEVRRIARQCRDESAAKVAEALNAFVMGWGPARGVRALSERWGARYGEETLAQWLVKAVQGIDAPAPGPATVLELVATHAVRQQRREQEGGAQ